MNKILSFSDLLFLTSGGASTFDPESSTCGKLVANNHADMSKLSVTARAMLITLSQPCFSDDYGHVDTRPGNRKSSLTVSDIADTMGISPIAVSKALAQLRENDLLSDDHPETGVLILNGAASYIPDYEKMRKTQLRWARKKRDDVLAARARRKEASKSNAAEKMDDGNRYPLFEKNVVLADTGHLHPLPLPNNPMAGYLHPMSCGIYRRSIAQVIGTRTGKGLARLPFKYEPLVPVGNTTMFPPFNVFAGMSPLTVCINWFLRMNADDYGKAKVDVREIANWLGRQILKKNGGHAAIEAAIASMAEVREGQRQPVLQLMDVRGREYKYAYVLDSARLSLRTKRDGKGPMRYGRLHHNSSPEYLEFFRNLKVSEAARKMVKAGDFSRNHTWYLVWTSVKSVAEEWHRRYYTYFISVAYRNGYDDRQICEAGANICDLWYQSDKSRKARSRLNIPAEVAFIHAIVTGQDDELITNIMTDEVPGDNLKFEYGPEIMRFLLGGLTSVEWFETGRRPMRQTDEANEHPNEEIQEETDMATPNADELRKRIKELEAERDLLAGQVKALTAKNASLLRSLEFMGDGTA